MSMVAENMKMIAECADKSAHLGEKLFNETEMKTIKTGTEYFVELPEGYQFVDENGNVIEATKIVLEKKKPMYPKSYLDCLKVLGIGDYAEVFGYKCELLNQFQTLLVCRDAYWKIAGEEMGLGKPWKPDYDSGVDKFGITCYDGMVTKTSAAQHWERHLNKVLDFPTKEMRDAFYECFKKEIEQCKELL